VLRRGDHLQLNPATNVTATAKFMPRASPSARAPGRNGNISCTSPVLHNQSASAPWRPPQATSCRQLTDNASDVTVLVVSNAYTISSVSGTTRSSPLPQGLRHTCGGAGECAGGICAERRLLHSGCAASARPVTFGQRWRLHDRDLRGAGTGRGRPAHDGSACGGACDGSSARLRISGASTQCRAAELCRRNVSARRLLQTAPAACPSAATTNAPPFVCGVTACKTSCAADRTASPAIIAMERALASRRGGRARLRRVEPMRKRQLRRRRLLQPGLRRPVPGGNVAGSVGPLCRRLGAPAWREDGLRGERHFGGGSCDGSNFAACAYPMVSCRGAVARRAWRLQLRHATAPDRAGAGHHELQSLRLRRLGLQDELQRRRGLRLGRLLAMGRARACQERDGLACGGSNQCGSGAAPSCDVATPALSVAGLLQADPSVQLPAAALVRAAAGETVGVLGHARARPHRSSRPRRSPRRRCSSSCRPRRRRRRDCSSW